MEIQDLNNLANDAMVHRILEQSAKVRVDQILAENKEYQEALILLEVATAHKNEAQKEMMEAMAENHLKSWKTEKANFARAIRKSVVFDPILKKHIETKVKNGEEVEGWELKETEYISVKLTK